MDLAAALAEASAWMKASRSGANSVTTSGGSRASSEAGDAAGDSQQSAPHWAGGEPTPQPHAAAPREFTWDTRPVVPPLDLRPAATSADAAAAAGAAAAAAAPGSGGATGWPPGGELQTALSVIDETQAKEGPSGDGPQPRLKPRQLTVGGAPRKASDAQV